MSSNSSCTDPSEHGWPKEWPKANQNLALFLAISLFIYGQVGLLLMAIRRNVQPVKRHEKMAIGVCVIGIYFHIIAILIREYVGRDVFPCDWYLWTTMMIVPMVGGSFVVRLQQIDNKAVWQNTVIGMKMPSMDSSVAIDSTADDQSTESDLETKKYLASKQNSYISLARIVGVFIGVISIYYLVVPVYGSNCYGCNLSAIDIIFFCSVVASFVIYSLYKIYRTKALSDDRHLLDEARTMTRMYGSSVVIWALCYATDPGNLQRDGILSWSYILHIAHVIYITYQVYGPVYQSFETLPCFKQTHNELENISLKEVLANGDSYQLFEEHVREEFSVENLRFWTETTQWKEAKIKSLERGSSPKINRKAYIIYNRFVKHGAFLEINLHAKTRRKLQILFEGEHQKSKVSRMKNSELKEIAPDTFDEAIEEIYKLMENDSFHRFLDSKRYKDYSVEVNPMKEKIKLVANNVATAVNNFSDRMIDGKN